MSATINDTFRLPLLKAELARDEGRRRFPYYDTGMRVTIGCGRNLADVGLRDDEIDYLLDNDIAQATSALDHNLGWWRSLDAVRQRVMLNMCFNMGWTNFSQFARFFSATYQRRWDDAAAEMLSSRWAGQVGDRAKRLAAMMQTGIAED